MLTMITQRPVSVLECTVRPCRMGMDRGFGAQPYCGPEGIIRPGWPPPTQPWPPLTLPRFHSSMSACPASAMLVSGSAPALACPPTSVWSPELRYSAQTWCAHWLGLKSPQVWRVGRKRTQNPTASTTSSADFKKDYTSTVSTPPQTVREDPKYSQQWTHLFFRWHWRNIVCPQLLLGSANRLMAWWGLPKSTWGRLKGGT